MIRIDSRSILPLYLQASIEHILDASNQGKTKHRRNVSNRSAIGSDIDLARKKAKNMSQICPNDIKLSQIVRKPCLNS